VNEFHHVHAGAKGRTPRNRARIVLCAALRS
jgi:hypothetical protein